MNKKHVIFAIVVAATVFAGLAFVGDNSGGPEVGKFSFTYNEANEDLQLLLVEHDIDMSSPLKLNGFSIEKYCTFFSNAAIQKSIEYCTSTVLLDHGGNFLGNIQMVGSNQRPEYVIAAIQTDPSVSQSNDLKAVIKTMIDILVCSCWEEESPGGFAAVSDWIDAAETHHADGLGSTSRSEISGLADKQLLLEITTNSEGHLWKFVISN